ncbi:hypothetical protein D1818_19645 [Aquimarina sp. BL5]|uniref:hypothetical protein n=1 Tax=Aquimarina sp. BL5 TaxID=1714860 RepID=UPI000E5567D6|nr:hypothetical protein [Aquimarina sp. BL5]AXT52925.1 hypothetical protein D1818_19645 [Aquimarina sp. BL5]RKM89794.1 hypothetical protein D7036_24360 [Aquimarina sp. BL5]
MTESNFTESDNELRRIENTNSESYINVISMQIEKWVIKTFWTNANNFKGVIRFPSPRSISEQIK